MAEASGIAMPTRRHALVLGAEGIASSVERRLDEFERICKSHGSEISGRISGGEYEALIEGISGLCHTADGERPSLSACISAPCGEAPEIFEMLDELESENGEGPQLAAHLGSGSLYSRLFFAGQEDIGGIAGKMADSLMRRFPRSNLTIFGVSGDAASRVPFITGNLTSSAWRESIKNCLDPEGLLNPGMPKW